MSGWMPYFIAVLLVVGSLLPVWAASHASELPPALMLAKRYLGTETIADYGVSEKYDGVRAYWDGMSLVTRSGRTISAPEWFLAQIPDATLDGELWLGYGRFSEISGLIRRKDSDSDALWQQVKFMVFDLPEEQGSFSERYQLLQELMKDYQGTECVLVEQKKISSHEALDVWLNQTVEAGGEGLMLHHWDSYYHAGRSTDLLKVTLVEDAEAVVVGHEPGKGRLKGMMGALKVRLKNGREFLLGTGFSNSERASPPPVGETVRFTYRGMTSDGLPRFASFDRIRPPE